MEGTLAELRGFAGNFAPRNWAYCGGQLLSINQNQALFSLLGTTYGGDGRTTFGLPDLRGRAFVGQGHGPGLTDRPLGQRSGNEWNYLTSNNLPSHTHTASNNLSLVHNLTATYTPAALDGDGTEVSPAGNAFAKLASDAGDDYATSSETDATFGAVDAPIKGTVAMSGSLVCATAGASSAVTNMAPFLACNWIICVSGTFPSRS